GSRITTEARSVGGILEVAVLDEGPGVPPEKLELVFESFHGAASPGAQASGDLGLGLTICRGIVAAHGGRSWAESRAPGSGAVFRFTLPLAGARSKGAG